MPETPEAMLRRKVQEGKAAIMDAIVEFLKLNAGSRFSRSEIESKLGLKSKYTTNEGESERYPGALASMLLSELAEDGRVKREGGYRQKKMYWFPRSGLS